MSFKLIREGINKIPNVKSWKLALINYNHKLSPSDYECHLIRFETDKLLNDTVNNMCEKFMYIIEKKTESILEYSGMNPKNSIDKINISNELISDQWDSLILSLSVCDDQKDIEKIESKAFVFVGEYFENEEHKNLYLLSRKNPIQIFKNKIRYKYLATRKNQIKEFNEPIIHFGNTFDVLIYGNVLYSINNNFQTVFNLEYSHRKFCKKALEEIENLDIISDFEAYQKFSLSGQTPKQFTRCDFDVINNLRNKRNLEILTKKLKIPYNKATQQFDLSDDENAKIFTKAICGKTKYEMFNDGICEVPSSIPLSRS